MRTTRLASQLIYKHSVTKHIPRIHARRHFVRTMATARTIDITPENTGLTRITQTEAAAKKATELLQQDLEVCSPLPIPLCQPHFSAK